MGCVVTTVNHLALGSLKTKHLTNGDKCKGHAVIQTNVFDMICMLPRQRSAVLRVSTHDVSVNCILLSKRLYIDAEC